MNQLVLRTIRERDYPAVAALVQNELGYSGLHEARFFERLRCMEEQEAHTTFVALHADQVVGFIGLVKGIAYEVDGCYLRIIALAVSQSYQSMGVGSALLRHAQAYAEALGISTIAVNSGLQRLPAHAFYEKNGFVKKSFGFSKTTG